jgi:hypothetical protein
MKRNLVSEGGEKNRIDAKASLFRAQQPRYVRASVGGQ